MAVVRNENDSDISFHFQAHDTQIQVKENTQKRFASYQPKNQDFAFINLQKLDGAKLRIHKNQAYFGQVVDGKKNGSGLLMYDNGRTYEGQFYQDLKSGSGIEQFQQGSFYDGEYLFGKPHGQGSFFWPNGESYEGQWKDGVKHGFGYWQGNKGDSYKGQWVLGKAQGKGQHVWVNGDSYEGDFFECLKHGSGKEFFANGDCYIGTYEVGKPEGYGEYYWTNGAIFKGYFKNGLRNGKGLWRRVYDNGLIDQYQGEYQNDKKSGQGLYVWSNGSEYKGQFLDDYKHGNGEMRYTDGRLYKGLWNKGKLVNDENVINDQVKFSVKTNNQTNPSDPIKIKQYSSDRRTTNSSKQNDQEETQKYFYQMQNPQTSNSRRIPAQISFDQTTSSGFRGNATSTNSSVTRRPSKSFVQKQALIQYQSEQNSTDQQFFQKIKGQSYFNRPKTNSGERRNRLFNHERASLF